MTLPVGNEEILFAAVESGLVEVRPDGSVWRIAYRRKSARGNVTVRQTEPHRIDAAINGGYRFLKIMIDGKQTSCPAHRLVYRVLVGPIPAGLTINHENGVKSDNSPGNLSIATYSEQRRHAFRTGLAPLRTTNREIAGMRAAYASGKVTQTDLSEAYGLSDSTVSQIIRGTIRQEAAGPIASGHRQWRTHRGRDALGKFLPRTVRMERVDILACVGVLAKGGEG